jgi:hypothetical protein
MPLLLLTGCGVQEYESLVKGRLQQLKAEGQTEPIEWTEFRSTVGVLIDFPGPANPVTNRQGEATAEELSVEAAKMEFRSAFVSGPTVESSRLADSSQQQFSNQGYSLTQRRESSLGNYTYVEVTMEHPETGDQVVVRAFQLTPQQGCVLSVTGDRLADNADVSRFLDSVRAG